MDLKTGGRGCGSTDCINLYQDRDNWTGNGYAGGIRGGEFLGFNVHWAVHRNIIYIVKPTTCTSVSSLFYFGMTLYMFRTVFPSIIRYKEIPLSCLLAGRYETFHLVPASKQTAVSVWQVPVAVCTVLNWWWMERSSETCRVSFQNKIHLIHWCI